MHELSICESLLREVHAIFVKHGAVGIERVRVEVGLLSGVEPALLDRAFDVARAGSCAADAILSIDVIPVVVRCAICQMESQTPPNRLLCAGCHSHRVRVISGHELLLRQVELRLPHPSIAAAY